MITKFREKTNNCNINHDRIMKSFSPPTVVSMDDFVILSCVQDLEPYMQNIALFRSSKSIFVRMLVIKLAYALSLSSPIFAAIRVSTSVAHGQLLPVEPKTTGRNVAFCPSRTCVVVHFLQLITAVVSVRFFQTFLATFC